VSASSWKYERHYSELLSVLNRRLFTLENSGDCWCEGLITRIEEEIRGEIDRPRVAPEPAERMVVGINGAFVKAGHTRQGQRHQFEILTGRVETSQLGGEAFAVVRDLDPYAKRLVQAILRRCGRGEDTDLRILSNGEDGLRGVVGWFGKKCICPSSPARPAQILFTGRAVAARWKCSCRR
jgi:hypothetical protein